MRPREYAAQIMRLETKQERKKALEEAPLHLQGIIRTHVEIQFQLRHNAGQK